MHPEYEHNDGVSGHSSRPHSTFVYSNTSPNTVTSPDWRVARQTAWRISPKQFVEIVDDGLELVKCMTHEDLLGSRRLAYPSPFYSRTGAVCVP